MGFDAIDQQDVFAGGPCWKLLVRPDQTATLTCDDGNGNIVYRKTIEHTDFPLDEIAFYFIDNVILLPSEY